MSTTSENSGASSTNTVQPAFFDFLRFVLGWKNAAGYIVTPDQRRKATPEGIVHVPTAICGKVQI